MALKIEQRENEGIPILDLTGELTMGPEDEELRTAIQSCIRNGQIRIALNFGQVRALDSVGLGTLVYFHVKLWRAGGKLALFNLARTHMQLLVLAKLDRVFEVFENEQDAVDSFFPDRAVRHYDILTYVRQLERERQRSDSGGGTSHQTPGDAHASTL